MSHVASIAVELKDLAALKLAAQELGGQWVEGKKTYNWYGQWVGDTPLPKHLKREELGKCSHVIKVPGVHYEVGVVKLPNGNYTLAYDFFNGGPGHDGHKLLEKFGQGCKNLVQSYAAQRMILMAKAQGHIVTRKQRSDGYVELQVLGIK